MRESLLSREDEQYAVELEQQDTRIPSSINDTNNKIGDRIDDNRTTDEIDDNDNDDDTDDDDDEDSVYGSYYKSVRTSTGLEIGCSVTWPGCTTKPEILLSTCLPETSIAPIFHGTQWAGTRLWRAAIVATQYLLHISSTSNNATTQQLDAAPDTNDSTITIHQDTSGESILINENTTILELGCGLGVPGMILHCMKDSTVILTDRDDLISQVEENIQKNFGNSLSTSIEESTIDNEISTNNYNDSLLALPLDWSAEGITTLIRTIEMNNTKKNPILTNIANNGFDIVVCCDCIFEPLYGRDSWKKLLQCQEELLRYNPNTYMLNSVERRNMDGIENYLHAATHESSIIQKVEQITNVPFQYPSEIELYRFYG